MTTSLLPLNNQGERFRIEILDTNYLLTCRWCDELDGAWILDIQNGETLEYVCSSLPVVTGGDILDGLNLGFSLYATTSGNQLAPPTFENLGTEGFVFVVTP